MMNYKELKSIFARVLLPLGYTAAKNMFFRRIGEVILIVDLQKSTFGGNYYVNIGLFVDEEAKLTQPPPFHKTHLKQTLTSIVPQVVRDKLVPALDLEVAMRADDRSDIITSAMVRYGLPFLTPLGSIEGIADFLDPQKRNFALVTLALRSIISRRTGRDDVLLPEQRIQRGGSDPWRGQRPWNRPLRGRLQKTDRRWRLGGVGAMNLDSKVPAGPLAEKWSRYKRDQKLISPANKAKYTIIVVGTGLAGASTAASLAELGYKVLCFCFQDSPRRAHSIAAQGGINAAKNYRNDGDSIYRLFYDTIKGGDFRSREANVHRLAEVSVNIIDQCVAQGVPFAREYGGLLDTRSFGGAQLQRTFYCRGQTGQQLLLGAYQALSRQIALGNVTMFPRCEMLDLVVIDGRARGIVTRHLETGKIESFSGDAVVLGTGGYGNLFFLSTNAIGCNVTAIYRAYKRGAAFANPCFTQIHPTCIPVSGEHQSKLTLMSESLRNDGRVWVPKNRADVGKHPRDIAEWERDYYLERKYPSFGNLAPRDIASRAAKEACDDGRGVGPGGRGVYLDFADAIAKQGKNRIEEKYGNLFEMYERITDENGYERPMRIYPAVHYTMGGLWVNYELMSNLPGLFVIGEANFSDHGANRLGASALMQGLADGYFVLPYTITNWLAQMKPGAPATDHAEFRRCAEEARGKLSRLLAVRGKKTAVELHRELGLIMWEQVGMARSRAGLESAIERIRSLRAEFWETVNVTGTDADLNAALERANRVADYMEFGELLARDALEREESCGGHFRTEHQTADGEARRDDARFCHVAAWEYAGEENPPARHEEGLVFESVKLAERSYK